MASLITSGWVTGLPWASTRFCRITLPWPETVTTLLKSGLATSFLVSVARLSFNASGLPLGKSDLATKSLVLTEEVLAPEAPLVSLLVAWAGAALASASLEPVVSPAAGATLVPASLEPVVSPAAGATLVPASLEPVASPVEGKSVTLFVELSLPLLLLLPVTWSVLALVAALAWLVCPPAMYKVVDSKTDATPIDSLRRP